MFGHEKYRIAVSEYVTPNPITIGLNTKLEEINDLFSKNEIRHLPVVDKKKPVGIISQRDIKILMNHIKDKNIIAQDIMTPGPHVITLNTPLDKAAFDLSNFKIGSALIVCPKGELVGIFTTTDALNALIEIIRAEVEA